MKKKYEPEPPVKVDEKWVCLCGKCFDFLEKARECTEKHKKRRAVIVRAKWVTLGQVAYFIENKFSAQRISRITGITTGSVYTMSVMARKILKAITFGWTGEGRAFEFNRGYELAGKTYPKESK
jgi:hypothetical protein